MKKTLIIIILLLINIFILYLWYSYSKKNNENIQYQNELINEYKNHIDDVLLLNNKLDKEKDSLCAVVDSLYTELNDINISYDQKIDSLKFLSNDEQIKLFSQYTEHNNSKNINKIEINKEIYALVPIERIHISNINFIENELGKIQIKSYTDIIKNKDKIINNFTEHNQNNQNIINYQDSIIISQNNKEVNYLNKILKHQKTIKLYKNGVLIGVPIIFILLLI